MKTAVYTELTPQLAKQWEALWEARRDVATAFNSPQWLAAARHAFGPAEERIITVSTDDGTLKAVCALVKCKLYGVTLYAAPAPGLADKPSILVDWSDYAAVRTLTAALKKLGIVYLSYCPAGITNSIQGGAGNNLITFQDDQTVYVDFKNGPHAELSTNTLRKIDKRISKSPERVSMSHSEHAHDELLTTAFDIEKRSTKNLRGMGVLIQPEIQSFFRRLASLKPELVHVSTMNVGRAPIAFSIDLYVHNTYQGSQKAYLRGYEQLQPGKYLVTKLLEYNYTKGRSGFDFGRGYDSFKAQFIKNPRPTYTVILAGPATGRYLSFIRSLRDRVYNIVFSQKQLYKAFKSMRAVFV